MKNRNPFASFILSFCLSGLGQLYNGELKKGIIFLTLLFPIYLLLGLMGIFSKFTGFLFVIFTILFYKLLVSIEAFRSAKRLNPYELKPINKIWKYLLFIIVGYGVTWVGSTINRHLIGYEAFEIPTSSMEPSLNVGDKIIATTIDPKTIQMGDIITFQREDGQKYLSRVVGLPNQQITIKHDQVFYAEGSEQWVKTITSNDRDYDFQEYSSVLPNGRQFQTKKILKYQGNEFPETKISNIALQSIPANKVYVLGDNRNNSMDSRIYGLIDLSQIDKKVNYIWWSETKSRIGIKLDE